MDRKRSGLINLQCLAYCAGDTTRFACTKTEKRGLPMSDMEKCHGKCTSSSLSPQDCENSLENTKTVEDLADMFITGEACDEPPQNFLNRFGPEKWAVFQLLYSYLWGT